MSSSLVWLVFAAGLLLLAGAVTLVVRVNLADDRRNAAIDAEQLISDEASAGAYNWGHTGANLNEEVSA